MKVTLIVSSLMFSTLIRSSCSASNSLNDAYVILIIHLDVEG